MNILLSLAALVMLLGGPDKECAVLKVSDKNGAFRFEVVVGSVESEKFPSHIAVEWEGFAEELLEEHFYERVVRGCEVEEVLVTGPQLIREFVGWP